MLVRSSRCVLEVHAGVGVGRSISKGPRGWRATEPDHGKLFYAIFRSLNFISHSVLWEAAKEF